VFIKHQITSYVLNFLAQILPILGLTGQTMIDSPFHVMWLVGLEVQITTCMNMFPVHFRGQFRAPLHNQDVQEWKSIISLNFHCECDGMSNAAKVVKKIAVTLLAYPNHESVVDVSEPFSEFPKGLPGFC
jgi:hypothetical protein